MNQETIKYREYKTLLHLTEKINEGITLDEVLNDTYDSFKSIIPYDRMSLALIDDDQQVVRSIWVRTDYEDVFIKKGYAGRLNNSSLNQVIETNQPRIINDLHIYHEQNPGSDSTKHILREGVRSSLTCPLIARGRPIGFLFFSSKNPDTYRDAHVDVFIKIAGQLSLIAEKSRLYEKLVELNDLKNKFIGIVAHDLRSPLSVIKSNLELFDLEILGPLTDKQKESVDTMYEWCNRMLSLIKNLLNVSAIESGKLELHKKSTDLSKYLPEELGFSQLLAQAKSITLELDVPGNIPPVDLDPERMSQVLNNLITNAIKFSGQGTQIRIAVYQKDKQIHIAVQDQGQGIPPKEIPKLFEFFSRTSVRPTAGEATTGIGLAIVKRIVEAHGGHVSVASEVGKGSTFTVILPLKD